MDLVNFVGFMGSGLLAVSFLIVGMPLYYEKIKPNIFFGYYLSKASLSNEKLWYAVNKMGGMHMIVLGMFFSINSAVAALFFSDLDAQLVVLKINIFICVLGILYSLLRTAILTMQITDQTKKIRKATN